MVTNHPLNPRFRLLLLPAVIIVTGLLSLAGIAQGATISSVSGSPVPDTGSPYPHAKGQATGAVTATITMTVTVTPTATLPVPTYTASTSPTATATATCQPGFEIVASPNVGTADNYLTAIDALADDDIWAVGYYSSTQGYRTLVEHWDGAQWSIVPSPNPPASNSRLSGVSAIAPDDIWAVGSGAGYALAEHWDGVSWSIVEGHGVVPAFGLHDAGSSHFSDVSGVTSDDVWAVGSVTGTDPWYHSGTCEYIAHWDGSRWNASLGGSCSGGLTEPRYELFGVSARAADDVWAVGGYSDMSGINGELIYHWDGAHWNLVLAPTPSPGNYPSLSGVSALSENDVWAVGSYFSSSFNAQRLVEHWDGSQWSVVPSAIPPQTRSNYLYGIAALTANDMWAVGQYYTGTVVPYQAQALVEHWDGARWSVVPDTRYSAGADRLASVSAVSEGQVWAVGSVDYGDVNQTLIERYSPCPVCTRNFRDVSPSDYFYQAVQYLYCAGAISGYSDGTFRPYSNTTRGQMAKIVVLGFGLPIDTGGGPHFRDIPTTHPFYQYIETALHNGIVSGYDDGTFRPSANVTRGQLSKIVVVAAIQQFGWTLSNPASPTFTDVLPGSAFYRYVETAVSEGVISGYSDRTFRPTNDATRGQIAKIVYLTITHSPTTTP